MRDWLKIGAQVVYQYYPSESKAMEQDMMAIWWLGGGSLQKFSSDDCNFSVKKEAKSNRMKMGRRHWECEDRGEAVKYALY